MRWKPALNAFAITFGDRFPGAPSRRRLRRVDDEDRAAESGAAVRYPVGSMLASFWARARLRR
jgi:hypothetical protein